MDDHIVIIMMDFVMVLIENDDNDDDYIVGMDLVVMIMMVTIECYIDPSYFNILLRVKKI